MAKFAAKDGEIEVPEALIARMADRMRRLGGKGRREQYAAKARARIDTGSTRPVDAAIVLAAGG
ncbi:MAG: hypothetical protein ACREFQ_18575 [Stellaceae bacterium]